MGTLLEKSRGKRQRAGPLKLKDTLELSCPRPTERGEPSLCASLSTETELDVESHVQTSAGVASETVSRPSSLSAHCSVSHAAGSLLPKRLPRTAELAAFQAETSEETPPLLGRTQ